MTWIRWSGVLAVLALALGCTGGPGPVADDGAGGGASPVENYKEQRMRDAMRGLSYDTGRVTLTSESGKVAQRGTAQDAARIAAEADRVFQTNDWPAAIGLYTKAVIVAPDRAATYLGLAQALRPKGRDAEAEAALRTAIDLDPKNLSAHVALARVVDSRGESQATVAAWRQVSALDSRNSEAHARIAVATYYMGDARGAWRAIGECERLGGEVPSQFKDMVRSEVGSTRP
jgi:tetratricopeptide (TPR) repeat protein